MACALGLPELANHNPFIRDLEELGYQIDFVGSVIFPGYPKTFIADVVTLPASFGEIGTCLWLLIMGARSGFQRVHSGDVAHLSS